MAEVSPENSVHVWLRANYFYGNSVHLYVTLW